jgi:hypothetical protein
MQLRFRPFAHQVVLCVSQLRTTTLRYYIAVGTVLQHDLGTVLQHDRFVAHHH